MIARHHEEDGTAALLDCKGSETLRSAHPFARCSTETQPLFNNQPSITFPMVQSETQNVSTTEQRLAQSSASSPSAHPSCQPASWHFWHLSPCQCFRTHHKHQQYPYQNTSKTLCRCGCRWLTPAAHGLLSACPGRHATAPTFSTEDRKAKRQFHPRRRRGSDIRLPRPPSVIHDTSRMHVLPKTTVDDVTDLHSHCWSVFSRDAR